MIPYRSSSRSLDFPWPPTRPTEVCISALTGPRAGLARAQRCCSARHPITREFEGLVAARAFAVPRSIRSSSKPGTSAARGITTNVANVEDDGTSQPMSVPPIKLSLGKDRSPPALHLWLQPRREHGA